MTHNVKLTQGQIDYATKIFSRIRDKRASQIESSTRVSSTAQLELLAIDDLVNALKAAKPIAVELPVLEQLG